MYVISLQLRVLLFDGDGFHFQQHAQGQLLHCHTRTSGQVGVGVEVLAVHFVEQGELVVHVGQKDGVFDDVVQRRIRRFQDVFDVLDHLFGSSFHRGIGQGLVFRSVRDLARHVDEAVNLDSLRVRRSGGRSSSGLDLERVSL